MIMKSNNENEMKNVVNTINELNVELRSVITDKMFHHLIDIVKSQPNQCLFTQSVRKIVDEDGGVEFCDECTPIYTYMYVDDVIVEREVKALKYVSYEHQGKLIEDIIVLADLNCVYYDDDDEDVLDEDKTLDEQWYSLFGGELLGWFTIINIYEVIEEYISR